MSDTWIQGKYCHAEYLSHLECWVVRDGSIRPVIFVDTKAEAQAAVDVYDKIKGEEVK